MPENNFLTLYEAVSIALLNCKTRTADLNKIAKFINERDLFPIRNQDISLENQILSLTNNSNDTDSEQFNDIEDIGAGYIRLRDCHAYAALEQEIALAGLLKFDDRFYNPQVKELSVIDRRFGDKLTRLLDFKPSTIVCILSQEKSRKKDIYFLEPDLGSLTQVEFNSNSLDFKRLLKYLDPFNDFLTIVSKSAIVNVGFYRRAKKDTLEYSASIKPPIDIREIKISSKSSTNKFNREFNIIKNAHNRRILLQKTVLGCKSSFGLL